MYRYDIKPSKKPLHLKQTFLHNIFSDTFVCLRFKCSNTFSQ